ncbi:hypothetical protein K450DRAFT_224054 [Umbelopsis ramanniana AG]|uniref:Transcriptional repressor Tup1 N-terminal domain-containing protein n=1 Tax=Umbelopsis ramanniana AG TaxID=1314678 RepID=A0AAD5HG22_UMBRA|nr:uncharacterized protein K450DRAFT_224054 [Umbelopsis ramanniana AG]KAI8583067.1 hypothetical protein K450DRAFT_224054 [Umbelopsis ramanniana AG]
MSVYNHRPMVPAAQSRIVELLEAIRAEFDQLSQEAMICKSQRDDLEHKINGQIQEMNAFQQSLFDMERTQKTVKQQYEEEIARLRQQLEQARSGHAPMTSSAHSAQHPQPPPPNIGPQSNLFGGIMNASGGSGASTSQPGLVAPPQMSDQPPPPHGGHYPPPQSQGYPYPPSRSGGPGTPNSQAAPLPTDQGANKRKPVAQTGPAPLPTAPTPGRPVSTPKQPIPAAATGGGFTDLDPDNVPPNMKTEGSDWLAVFNPKIPRYLKVDLVHTLDHTSVVCCVKFSPDGRYLAAGCNRQTHIYDVTTSTRMCVLQDESVSKDGDLYIRSVCFSPDGKFLATGAEDKQIRIWDISKRRIRNVLTGHEQDIYSLDFSRDGRIIVSGSGDRTARIWSMADATCLHTLRINENDQKDPGVTSVAISPDSRYVAAGSLDKIVRVWDVQTGHLLERLEGHKDSVYSVAFMPDGKTIVSGSLDKTLKLWQLGVSEGRGFSADRDRKNPCKQTLTGHKDFVLSVACTADGNWVVSGSKDRAVQFWDPRTGNIQFVLKGHRNSVISVATSPAGRHLFATGSGDNRARIWSYEPIGP